MRTLAVLLAASALVGCVGDSSPSGGDAAPDVTVGDGSPADSAPIDATSDASDGGAFEAGDAGCVTATYTDLSANCAQVPCVHANAITCEQSISACKNTNNGKPVGCGTTADCDASACCLASTFNVKAACPFDAVVGLTTSATACTTQTTGACPGNQVQVCVTSAECVTGTCQDTVFDFNGTKSVHFGTCQ